MLSDGRYGRREQVIGSLVLPLFFIACVLDCIDRSEESVAFGLILAVFRLVESNNCLVSSVTASGILFRR